MTRPYSDDLRQRAVASFRSGQSSRHVAKTFGISVSAVIKWAKRERETGSVSPGKMGGHRPFILEGERAWLLDRINSDADVTLRGLQAELAERGVVASYGAIWNFMHRQGLSHKKNRIRKRARSPGHRAETGAMEKAPGED